MVSFFSWEDIFIEKIKIFINSIKIVRYLNKDYNKKKKLFIYHTLKNS
jgi:hypothetical protein